MTHVENKRQFLRIVFGKEYEAWKDQGYSDDRMLFCNIYRILSDALDVMAGINNNLIWVGFNQMFAEKRAILESILQEFG